MKSPAFGLKFRGAAAVVRKSDGKIKLDLPDGSIKWITREEWDRIAEERLKKMWAFD